MFGVKKSMLPDEAILKKYEDSYTDCYSVLFPGSISLETYVQAFYTGRVFKLERWLIKTFAGLKSSQAQLDALLAGKDTAFSAWTLENRKPDQLLMCDFQKRTRSWFMVILEDNGTYLYFGSAVVPTEYWNSRTEKFAGIGYKLLMPFHRLYSHILLGGAVRILKKG